MADTAIPFKPSPLSLLYKIGAGLIGGLIGSGALLLIFSVTASILRPALEKENDGAVAPIFLLVFMAMIFVASLAANLTGNLLMGMTERSKYTRLATTIFQTFLLNLAIFIVTAPIYLLVNTWGFASVATVAALQVILSVMASAAVLEVISNPKYALLGVYTAVFGLIFGLLILAFLAQITENQFVTMFAALPIFWFSIGFFNSLLNLLYFQLYKFYGVDFLSSEENFGGDEEEKQGPEMISAEEIYEATTKDEKGGDFLKK